MESAHYNSQQPSAKRSSIVIQAAGLAVALVGILFGIGACYTIVVPGPGGEWTKAVVLVADVVDIPAGIMTLIIALAVKKGNRHLHRLCLIAGVLTLCLPLVAYVM